MLLTCETGSSLEMKGSYTILMLLTIVRYEKQRLMEQRMGRGQDYDMEIISCIMLHDHHRNIYHTIEAMDWT